MYEELIMMVASGVVTIVIALLGILVTRKVGVENLKKLDIQLSTINSLAYNAVMLAEDVLFGEGRGAERLEYASVWLSEELRRLGIKITPQQAEKFVRAMFKDAQKEIIEIRDLVRSK